VRRALDDLAAKMTKVQTLAQAAQDGVDGLNGTSADILYREYELDFSAQATASIASGDNTIDGLTWTGQPVTGQTFGIVAGSGLSYDTNSDNTSTNYSFGGVTSAAYLRLPLSTLWDAMEADDVTPDATWTMLVQAYASSQTIASNNSYWLIGIGGDSGTPGGSGNRGAAAMRLRANSTQCFKSRGDADGFNYPEEADVIGLKIDQDSRGTAVAGTWASDWPRMTHSMAVSNTVVQAFLDENSHLVLAFATNGTSADMQIVVERISARAWGVAA